MAAEHSHRTPEKRRKFTEESTRVCNKNDLKTSFQGAVVVLSIVYSNIFLSASQRAKQPEIEIEKLAVFENEQKMCNFPIQFIPSPF